MFNILDLLLFFFSDYDVWNLQTILFNNNAGFEQQFSDKIELFHSQIQNIVNSHEMIMLVYWFELIGTIFVSMVMIIGVYCMTLWIYFIYQYCQNPLINWRRNERNTNNQTRKETNIKLYTDVLPNSIVLEILKFLNIFDLSNQYGLFNIKNDDYLKLCKNCIFYEIEKIKQTQRLVTPHGLILDSARINHVLFDELYLTHEYSFLNTSLNNQSMSKLLQNKSNEYIKFSQNMEECLIYYINTINYLIEQKNLFYIIKLLHTIHFVGALTLHLLTIEFVIDKWNKLYGYTYHLQILRIYLQELHLNYWRTQRQISNIYYHFTTSQMNSLNLSKQKNGYIYNIFILYPFGIIQQMCYNHKMLANMVVGFAIISSFMGSMCSLFSW